jgi:hypothetical protein
LLDAIESEAELNFFGRVLTRSDMLVDLEARLQVIEAYKRHPEIDDEVITGPVFIIGFGRSGTTIIQDVLSLDPQFRSVRRWEAQFPWPAPEAATYEDDPRARRAQDLVDVVHAIAPEWRSMHAWGGHLTVEDLEFTHGAFLSEVWPMAFQIPSYERYFSEQDVTEHFTWHKKMLKLLQWKYRKPHWLLKNPTHLPRLKHLLETYPDAKIIFTHRDPVVSGDSVVNVMGAIYHWRTDNPFGSQVIDDWLLADDRAAMWDQPISWIRDGTIRKGSYANFVYAGFLADPAGTIQGLYRELGLHLSDDTLAQMNAFLEERHKGSHGNSQLYRKTAADDPVAREERAKYARYQEFFGVPNEI